MRQLRRESQALAESISPGCRPVHGDGDLDAALMLVGEAPGAEEERLGRPFVGPAGKFLDAEFARAGIDRSRIYITATVKCRPTRPGARGPRNRAPNARETAAWSDIVLREIEIVHPKVILCLGKVAARVVIGPAFDMGGRRGEWLDGLSGAMVTATFHPAYVRRFGTYKDRRVIEAFISDLASALAKSTEDD